MKNKDSISIAIDVNLNENKLNKIRKLCNSISNAIDEYLDIDENKNGIKEKDKFNIFNEPGANIPKMFNEYFDFETAKELVMQGETVKRSAWDKGKYLVFNRYNKEFKTMFKFNSEKIFNSVSSEDIRAIDWEIAKIKS